MIHITADSRYQLWVNGCYVGQGPTPFRKPWMTVDSFDITSMLHAGNNVLAILATWHGVPHCTYTVGMPGVLVAGEVVDLEGRRVEFVSNETWRAMACEAFIQKVPRRNGATAWMECFDARKDRVGWQQAAYEDVSWPYAQVVDPGPVHLLPRAVPALKEYPSEQNNIANIWQGSDEIPALDSLTRQLDVEPLTPVNREVEFPLVVEESSQAFALTVDLGKEVTGQIEVDLEAPEGVVIDLCPAENLQQHVNRPWCFRKGTNYAKRYITRQGRQSWRTFGYDGLRYVHAVVRGPHPKIVVHRLGVWRRETSLPIRATFECNDPVVNRLWQITCHTMTIGAQDVHVDCPTREQTSAWGDHLWSGLWETYLTGDVSHLRHLLVTMEQIQSPEGQVCCYPFSGVDYPLYDFSLLCVLGIWEYLRISGDRDLTQRLMPVADRILDWYRKEMGSSGLIELDGQDAFERKIGQLFIDHPGLNSHNHPYPSIDRRGISAGLNFFFIMALDAQRKCLEHLGQDARAQKLQIEADRMRVKADKFFFDPDHQVYVDAVCDGKRSTHLSQQTNALAILAHTCSPERSREILTRLLTPNDPKLCLCGTYFWTYLAEALCQSKMHKAMWGQVVQLWNTMAEQGATSWWETFLGDELDSLCHTWSCVPGYLILSEILGVKPVSAGFARIAVIPQLDLLASVRASLPVAKGTIAIEWSTEGTTKRFGIHNQTTSPVEVTLPANWQTLNHKTFFEIPPYSSKRNNLLSKNI
jgi:hypothetical protein